MEERVFVLPLGEWVLIGAFYTEFENSTEPTADYRNFFTSLIFWGYTLSLVGSPAKVVFLK